MLKRIFTTSFFSITSRFFSTATSLVTIFFITRFLDAGSLGRYGIAFFFFQLFIVTSYLGLEVFIGKEVAYQREDPGRLSRLFGETAAATLYGAVLSLVLALVFTIFYHRISGTLLMLTLGAGILYGLERNLGGFLLGREKVHIDTAYMVLSFVITVVLILAFKESLDIEKIFLIRIFSLLVGTAGRILSISRGIPGRGKIFRFNYFKAVKYYWSFALVVFLERQADLFILSLFIDDTALGGYFLSLRIYLTVNLVIEVAAQALTPFISRIYHGKEDTGLKTLYRYLWAASLVVGVGLGLLLFVSRSLIVSLFNPALVAETGPFLLVLSAAVPFKVGAYLMGALLSSSSYQKWRFYINLASTLVLVAVLGGAVHFLGAMGAVWARTGFEVVTFLASVYFASVMVKRPAAVEQA